MTELIFNPYEMAHNLCAIMFFESKPIYEVMRKCQLKKTRPDNENDSGAHSAENGKVVEAVVSIDLTQFPWYSKGDKFIDQDVLKC